MIDITAKLVRELRFKTGIGIMDCKKALLHSSGDIEEAIIYLRKHGKIIAGRKNSNLAAKGIVVTYIKENFGYMIELNCETDFVSRHVEFINFSNKILVQAHKQNVRELKWLKTIFEEERIILVSKFNENIIIRRFCYLEGDMISSYEHSGRVGVLLSAKSPDKNILKNISMHIAASSPEYINVSDIPESLINQEREVQLDITLKSGKSKQISKRIVDGRVNKFIDSISLLEQDFVMDTTKKVKVVLQENNVKIFKFFRFEIGGSI